MVSELLDLEGHIIDSDILRRVFSRIVEEGGEFEVVDFRVGKRNDDPSFARINVSAADPHALDLILEGLAYLGASPVVGDAHFEPAEADGILPDEFYSTTNFDTFISVGGRWVPVADQKMDCAIVLRGGQPRCVKQGRVRQGEEVALRAAGIRVRPPERSRDYSVFGFMSNDVSAEINKGIAIAGTAREMRKTRDAGERIVVVAGPRHRALGRRRGPRAARARRVGRRDPHGQRVCRARHGEGHPQDQPRRLPDERPGRRGRQPQPPLHHQRREPRRRHPRRGRTRGAHLGGDVRGDVGRACRSCSPGRFATMARSSTSSPTSSRRRTPTCAPSRAPACASCWRRRCTPSRWATCCPPASAPCAST
jgi:hypothetical protein